MSTLPFIPRNPWKTLAAFPETPFYIYDETTLTRLLETYKSSLRTLPVQTHFALKSNHNPHVLKAMKKAGFGLDIVSGGELNIAIKNGFHPKNLVFSGVGKTNAELEDAVRCGVGLINLESQSELTRLNDICRRRRHRQAVGLRLNPDIKAPTHPYISTGLSEHKFGVSLDEAANLCATMKHFPSIELDALSIHIGSQMRSFEALREGLEKVMDFGRQIVLNGQFTPARLDVGGGVGVAYDQPSQLPPFREYASVLAWATGQWKRVVGPSGTLVTELGRSLVAQSGWLLCQVTTLKQTETRTFAIVDAGMNDLLRPALYQATHPLYLFASQKPLTGRKSKIYDIAGPVCESSDVFARGVCLPELFEGDMMAIGVSGAYGHVMASHYNARPIPAEYWLPGRGRARLSRKKIPAL